MAIEAKEIEFRLSTLAGSGGDTMDGEPGFSLGRWVSRTPAPSAGLDALFPAVLGAEFIAGRVDYQCLFVVNRHPYHTLEAARIWMKSQRPGRQDMSIGLDNAAATDISHPSAQATSVDVKDVAPDGVSFFVSAVTADSGLLIGDLGPNQAKGVWIRRASTAGVCSLGGQARLTIRGGTGVVRLGGTASFTVAALGSVQLNATASLLVEFDPRPPSHRMPPFPDTVTLAVEGISPA